MDDSAFAGVRLRCELWPHQRRALEALHRDRAAGNAATYLVIPPGGGKTLVGLEAARQLARPTLVLCPNTAIQAQWIAQWEAAFTPPTAMAATSSRDLPTPLTVLTYQAVCTIGNGASAAARRPSRAPSPAFRLARLYPADGLYPGFGLRRAICRWYRASFWSIRSRRACPPS